MVVRDKRTGKTKGYGFISFANPADLAAALKEMNECNSGCLFPLWKSWQAEFVLGKYVGNRPIKLRKSKWRERTDFDALEKQKNHIRKKPKMSRKGILHK
ncbi:RNA-binding protein 42-like [Trifolium pratense]|uniref:RNA-binding protein 42-like n=1 Tax=Trifolium pratense TaxID=57577 RepID=A0A2K3P3S1_TRIPR|nr:RNA-binding protein 42-like [Trifolium pratense]